jgi:hypothetical protein
MSYANVKQVLRDTLNESGFLVSTAGSFIPRITKGRHQGRCPKDAQPTTGGE